MYCDMYFVSITRNFKMVFDPAIENFFSKRKENRLKKKSKEKVEEEFLLENWLPWAAERANQMSLSSHPCKFSHPASQKNEDAKTSSIIAKGQQRNDGYLRSGNADAEIDALGNAAVLHVYEFLTLRMEDGDTLLSHIEGETTLCKKLLNLKTTSYKTLRDGFLAIKNSGNSKITTSSRIKQVYFPLGDGNYHQLSILTPSGLISAMHKKIKEMKFGDKAKEARECRKKNEYSDTDFDDIIGLSIIGYGGTKPQNISVLNKKYRGKFHLLSSLPPVLQKGNIRLPKKDFFNECLFPRRSKEYFLNFHKRLNDSRKNYEVRKNIAKAVLYIFDDIVTKVWEIRQENSGWSKREQFNSLPIHQKHILDSAYVDERKKNADSIDPFLQESARWLVLSYGKVLGKNNALELYDDEIRHFKKIMSEEGVSFW